MEDLALFVAIEHAQAGQFFLVAVDGRVVVAGRGSAPLLVAEADAEVLVEIFASAGDPVELPSHALAKSLELFVGRMGHRHQRYIVMGQVLVGTIEMIGQERAPLQPSAQPAPNMK